MHNMGKGKGKGKGKPQKSVSAREKNKIDAYKKIIAEGQLDPKSYAAKELRESIAVSGGAEKYKVLDRQESAHF